MLETLIEKLIEKYLDPCLKWFFSLHKAFRGLLLALITLALLNFYFPGQFYKYKSLISHINSSVLFDESKLILSTDQGKNVSGVLSSLDYGLTVDLETLKKDGEQPWGLAQAILALTDVNSPNSNDVELQLRKVKAIDCSCWKEWINQREHTFPKHIPASAWAILALAYNQVRPHRSEVDFILKTQNISAGGGWWPVFPSNNNEFASTFATAWSIIALNKLIGDNLLDKDQEDKAVSALKSGQSWLISNREHEKGRWFDYPSSKSGQISLSLSGLAIYSLHQSAKLVNLDVINLDKEWVANLPENIPNAGSCEIPYIWVKGFDGLNQDTFCQLTVPWLIIGTAAIYENVTPLEKLTINSWVDRVILESKITFSDNIAEHWKRAEIIIALRALLGTFI